MLPYDNCNMIVIALKIYNVDIWNQIKLNMLMLFAIETNIQP